MRRLLFTAPATAGLLIAGIAASTQPAYAVPDCPTQVRIRCMGYSFNGKPPITGYDSVDECVAAETPRQCRMASNDRFREMIGKIEHGAEHRSAIS